MGFESMSDKSWIFLYVFTLVGLLGHGCSLHRSYAGENHDAIHIIAILDEPSPPNFSVTPAQITVKTGERVAWVNHTSSVIQFSLGAEDGQESPGLLKRLGSKAGLFSKEKADERLKMIEDALKEQHLQLEEIKTQLNSSPDPQQALRERLQALEERLKEQETQLSELKTPITPTMPQKPPQVPAFISPFATVTGRFDFPGSYIFTLFQSTASRRSSQVEGNVRVLP